jgi:hypothetical protein
LRIDENVPLLALDLLSRVVARRINRSPSQVLIGASFFRATFFVPLVLAIGW